MTVLRDPRVEVRPLAPGRYAEVGALLGSPSLEATGADLHRLAAHLWNGVLLQSTVHDARTDELVGLVTCYEADLRHGHAWIAVRGSAGSVGSGLVLLGLGHFIGHLFDDWRFDQLHAETSPEALVRFRTGWDDAFRVDGVLRGYHLVDGAPVDRYLLTIDRSRWTERLGPRFVRRRRLAQVRPTHLTRPSHPARPSAP